MKLFVIAGLFAGFATATTFTYSSFSSTAGLTLNGAATQSGSALQLVPSADTKAGTAFYTTPIALNGSTPFHTSFEFNVQTGANSAGPPDGFTFLLQNSAAGATALGDGGQGLGYVGIAPSVEVVFRGRGPSFIGVITGGVDPASLPIPFQPPGYKGYDEEGTFYGQNEYAWIDYLPGGTLDVYLSSTSSKPGAPVMSATVNVAGILGSQAYVGFSAGNGAGYGTQDILNWSFTTGNVPEPSTAGIFALGLSALALLRRARKR